MCGTGVAHAVTGLPRSRVTTATNVRACAQAAVGSARPKLSTRGLTGWPRRDRLLGLRRQVLVTKGGVGTVPCKVLFSPSAVCRMEGMGTVPLGAGSHADRVGRWRTLTSGASRAALDGPGGERTTGPSSPPTDGRPRSEVRRPRTQPSGETNRILSGGTRFQQKFSGASVGADHNSRTWDMLGGMHGTFQCCVGE